MVRCTAKTLNNQRCAQSSIGYEKLCRIHLLEYHNLEPYECTDDTQIGGYAETPEEIEKAKKEIKKQLEKEPSFFTRTLNLVTYPEIPYFRIPEKISVNLHLGQRKLLLSEIEFLTLHGHLSKLIVYAGAAHGIHIKYLQELFPKHYFDLYDPATFLVKPTKHIRIVNDLFLDSDAESYKGRDVLFISDVRTHQDLNDFSKFEKEVFDDMKMQEKWIEIMKPSMAMIKFRLPYLEDGDLEYLDGDVYFQVWAPLTSTETRLITNGQKKARYPIQKYNDQLFRFNRVDRRQRHLHDVDLEKVPGLDYCYDCRAEIEIIRNYLKKFGKNDSNDEIAKIMNRITKELGQPSRLDQGSHGRKPHISDVLKREKELEPISKAYYQKRLKKRAKFSKKFHRKKSSRKRSKS